MKYSIITSVYNREDCVARCIESVVRQTITFISGGVEHIIVNDGSSDRTGDICEDYARRYSHIRYIHFSENRGTNAGRNVAIREATGDWIIILDSDDYFLDDAIATIDTTIESRHGYKHYMFAYSHMIEKYESNYLLKGRRERELSFADFLSGCVSGDFTHVMCREMLLRYPFDEFTRVHEGVFFLRFYKEARRMLFTNVLVTIVARGRDDSASRDSLRTSKAIIERVVRSKEVNVEWFEEDYKALGLIDRLCTLYVSIVDNYILLGRYDAAKRYMVRLKEMGGDIGLPHKLIYGLRLGGLYRLLLKVFLTMKYNVLGAKWQM